MDESKCSKDQHETKQYDFQQELITALKYFRSETSIWKSLSMFEELSEEFIREFQKELNWEKISKHQKMSQSFIKEFSHRIDWNNLMENEKIDVSFIVQTK